MNSTAIIFCCEKGPLEPQTKVLVSSIKRFANIPDSVKLICFSPRKYFRPSRTTIKFLEQCQVEYIDDELNNEFIYNPYMNKPIVCNYVEKSNQFDGLIFLDTDTIVTGDFLSSLALENNVYLKPVFYKQIGCDGNNDLNHDLWEYVSHLLAIKKFYTSNTFATNQSIYGYWNSGFIAASTKLELFSRWFDNFKLLLKAKKWQNDRYFFMDQIALSGTIHQMQVIPKTPAIGVNYPISLHNEICFKNRLSQMEDLKIAHHFGDFNKTIKNLKKLSKGPSEKTDEIEQMIVLHRPQNYYYKLIQIRNTNLQKALYFRNKLFS